MLAEGKAEHAERCGGKRRDDRADRSILCAAKAKLNAIVSGWERHENLLGFRMRFEFGIAAVNLDGPCRIIYEAHG